MDDMNDKTAILDKAVEVAIRIGLVVLLLAWCFQTIRPFLQPAVWGIIIAIASYPGYVWLRRRLGGRRGLAATVFSLIGIAIILAPTVMLAETLATGVTALADRLEAGPVTLPPPPESIKEWSVIGQPIFDFWQRASQDLGGVVAAFAPQLKEAGTAVVSAAAGAGLGVLLFIVSIIIAAVLMMNADGGEKAAHAVARRLAGPRGPAYADLARATVRNVTRGILGVAFIQAFLAGIGFLAVGLPAAGLLALICLILATIQIGTALVMIPAAIYVFQTSEPVTGILFIIWAVIVSVSDNILKPLLLGRGASVPMLVIFLGAIGGFLASGIIGLFTGAVVLSLGYTLFVAWLSGAPAEAADQLEGAETQGNAADPPRQA